MISIDRHIEYLLIGHDCVIVPGLGAFVADRRSAAVTADGRMCPPSRSVGFNPDINHNDGLLAMSIARQGRISYDSAVAHLTTGVSALRAQLEADGEFTINRVGTLTLTPERTIAFAPAADSVESLAMGWLPHVSLAPARPEAEVPAEAPKVLPAPAVTPRRAVHTDGDTVYISLPRRILKVAACFCLLLTIGFVCSTPALNEASTSMASMPGAPAQRLEVQIEQPQPQAQEVVRFSLAAPAVDGHEVADTLLRARHSRKMERLAARQKAREERLLARQAAQQLQPAVQPSQPSEQESPLYATTSINPSHHYYVVVASLQSMRRARAFVAQTGGSGLQILEQGGRYRVVAASAPTEDSAKAKAASAAMQRQYPGAWVTER